MLKLLLYPLHFILLIETPSICHQLVHFFQLQNWWWWGGPCRDGWAASCTMWVGINTVLGVDSIPGCLASANHLFTVLSRSIGSYKEQNEHLFFSSTENHLTDIHFICNSIWKNLPHPVVSSWLEALCCHPPGLQGWVILSSPVVLLVWVVRWVLQVLGGLLVRRDQACPAR